MIWFALALNTFFFFIDGGELFNQSINQIDFSNHSNQLMKCWNPFKNKLFSDSKIEKDREEVMENLCNAF